jgi:hypothetical protein
MGRERTKLYTANLTLQLSDDRLTSGFTMRRNDMKRSLLSAALLSLGLAASSPNFADETSLPAEPQPQSPTTQSVQSDVEDKATEKADERRKKILADAREAIEETENALHALEENKVEEALLALERATGKLELMLARDPSMALAPVDVKVVTYDLLANTDTVKAIIHDIENYLEDNEIQKARQLMANLASEIAITSTSIPLATYPGAIKAITPMIDKGEIEEAVAKLRMALNTLVVTTDQIIPLPLLRAQQLLKNAEALAENQDRTTEDSELLAEMLADARDQLKMAELLGYGTKRSFKPMYEQLDQIETKTASGRGGKGWFDSIKQQLSQLF